MRHLASLAAERLGRPHSDTSISGCVVGDAQCGAVAAFWTLEKCHGTKRASSRCFLRRAALSSADIDCEDDETAVVVGGFANVTTAAAAAAEDEDDEEEAADDVRGACDAVISEPVWEACVWCECIPSSGRSLCLEETADSATSAFAGLRDAASADNRESEAEAVIEDEEDDVSNDTDADAGSDAAAVSVSEAPAMGSRGRLADGWLREGAKIEVKASCTSASSSDDEYLNKFQRRQQRQLMIEMTQRIQQTHTQTRIHA